MKRFFLLTTICIVSHLFSSTTFAETIKGTVSMSEELTLNPFDGKLKIACSQITANYTYTVPEDWSGEILPVLKLIVDKDFWSDQIKAEVKLELETNSTIGYSLSTNFSQQCSTSISYPNNVQKATFIYKSGANLLCEPERRVYSNITTDQVDQNFNCRLLKGDLNGNNRLGVEDCIAILQVIAGLRNDNSNIGDYDGNGRAGIEDCIAILKIAGNIK